MFLPRNGSIDFAPVVVVVVVEVVVPDVVAGAVVVVEDEPDEVVVVPELEGPDAAVAGTAYVQRHIAAAETNHFACINFAPNHTQLA